jgi:putative tryptophan/tyrosine transport system substrate-binding protein
MPVLGFLSSLAEDESFKRAFAAGLSTQSYVTVGWGFGPTPNLGAKEVYIYAKWAAGDYTKLDQMAKDLVAVNDLKSVAATGGLVSTTAVEKAKPAIPILFATGRLKEEDDSPGAHPSNSKGIYLGTTKKNVVLKDTRKILRRLMGRTINAFHLVNPRSAVYDKEKEWPDHVEAGTVAELATAFGDATEKGAEALTVSADSFFNYNKTAIITLANDTFKKPVAYPFVEYVINGGLVSAGPSLSNVYKQLGKWAGMLLNDSSLKPSELPDYKPRTEYGINLVTAGAFSSDQLPNLQEIVDDSQTTVVIGGFRSAGQKKGPTRKRGKKKVKKKAR